MRPSPTVRSLILGIDPVGRARSAHATATIGPQKKVLPERAAATGRVARAKACETGDAG